MPRRALPIAALLAAAALLVSACSIADPAAGGGGERDHHHQAPPATLLPASPHRPGPARTTAAPVRVVMNDNFRYQPASIVVRAGRRVTFAVHNAGRLPHEFILGDRATQLDHEHQMQSASTPMPTCTTWLPPRPEAPAPSPSPRGRPAA
jgi:hypothetical protein